MHQQLRQPSAVELNLIESTREAYRAMWSTLQHVPSRTFTGGPEDINTLDFLDYEAGHHPRGLSGAAIIWGGVLVHAGMFWAVGEASELLLVDKIDSPNGIIYPYGRIVEISDSLPQYGKYSWAFEEAVLHLCSLPVEAKILEQMKMLLEKESSEGFLVSAKTQINSLLHAGRRPSR